MQKRLRFLKKTASVALSVAMVCSLLGGLTMSVNAAVTNTTDEISDNFEGFTGNSDTSWTRVHVGLNKVDYIADNYYLNKVDVPGRGRVVEFSQKKPSGERLETLMAQGNWTMWSYSSGGGTPYNFRYTDDDIVKVSFEAYFPSWGGNSALFSVRAMYGSVARRMGFEMRVGGSTPTVYFVTNGGNTTVTTTTTPSEGKWHKYDMLINAKTDKAKLFLDGVLCEDANGNSEFDVVIPEGSVLDTFAIGWAPATTIETRTEPTEDNVKKGMAYVDNVSMTKVKDSSVWYADETVLLGTTDLTVSFDETPTAAALSDIQSNIIIEEFDVTSDKMLVGVPTAVTNYTIPGDNATVTANAAIDSNISLTMNAPGVSPAGVKLNLDNGLAANKAIRITIPGVETITGKTVDVVKVYYGKAPIVAETLFNEGFAQGTSGETRYLWAAGTHADKQYTAARPYWAATASGTVGSDWNTSNFEANITSDGWLKLPTNGSGTTRRIMATTKDLNLAVGVGDKFVVSADFKQDNLTTDEAGSDWVGSELDILDNAGKVLARVQMQQQPAADVISLAGYDGGSATTADAATFASAVTSKGKTNGLADVNNAKMEITFNENSYDIVYKVNDVEVGRKTQNYAITGVGSIMINNRSIRRNGTVYADNLTMNVTKASSSGSIKNILFADEYGNIMPTSRGTAPAGAQKLLIGFDNVDSIADNAITLSNAYVNYGSYAGGVYTIELLDVLVSDTNYTLTVPNTIAGGYEQTFTTGVADAVIGAVEFTDDTDTAVYAELPGVGTTVYTNVKVKNPTRTAVKGKLILQVFEYDAARDADVVKEVYIQDVGNIAYSGFCNRLSGGSFTVGANTSKARLILWDGYDTLKVLSESVEIAKPVVTP